MERFLTREKENQKIPWHREREVGKVRMVKKESKVNWGMLITKALTFVLGDGRRVITKHIGVRE